MSSMRRNFCRIDDILADKMSSMRQKFRRISSEPAPSLHSAADSGLAAWILLGLGKLIFQESCNGCTRAFRATHRVVGQAHASIRSLSPGGGSGRSGDFDHRSESQY